MTRTPLLTTTEVAQILGVERRTVNRMALSGKLPVAQRLPGQTGANLFDPKDVEAYQKRVAA